MQSIFLLERSKRGDSLGVILCLLLALTCKLLLAFLVLGIAVFLLLKRRFRLGCALAFLAMAWLVFVGNWLIPAFGGSEAGLMRHASKFGLQVGAGLGGLHAALLFLGAIAGNILSVESLVYLLLLMAPVGYVFWHKRVGGFFKGLLPFAPLLVLNLAAERDSLKDLVHHYSLFLVPFLASGVQETLAPGPWGIGGYRVRRGSRILMIILCWVVIAFVLFSRMSFFAGPFQQRLSNVEQVREAVALVDPGASLLTTNDIAPHVAHRQVIAITEKRELGRLGRYDQILLDRRYPGWKSSHRLVARIINRVKSDPCWRVQYEKGDVVLFKRSPVGPRCPG
jgi:uncharacterized membrane protein